MITVDGNNIRFDNYDDDNFHSAFAEYLDIRASCDAETVVIGDHITWVGGRHVLVPWDGKLLAYQVPDDYLAPTLADTTADNIRLWVADEFPTVSAWL
jgi:hypothetical protein